MAIPEQRITLEEFLQLPEEKPALEFEDGMVTQKVPPNLEVGPGGDFLQGFLNAIFPELALSRGRRFANRFDGKRLGDGDEPNSGRVAPG